MRKGRNPTLNACCICALLGVASCQVLAGYESFDERPPHPCDDMPTRRDTELGREVLIKVKDGRCFWIDETEVTVGQYRRFLENRPTEPWPPGSAVCAWKDQQVSGLVGSDVCWQKAAHGDPDPFNQDKPMRCVDWCDARAYCLWAGKDLCAITPATDAFHPARKPDEWTVACSPTSAYPYGSTVERRACNIGIPPVECLLFRGESKCSVSEVKEFTRCTYPNGPYDMIGNVSEWVLPCRTDVGDADAGDGSMLGCVHRGGSFEQDELEAYSCALPSFPTAPRNERTSTRGFRCCAPPS